MRNTFTDMANIALALLAHDRYYGVAHPVEYMKEEKRPARRLVLAFLLVIFANGIHLAGDVFSHHGMAYFWMHVWSWQITIWISDTIRALYTFICLFM